MWSILKGSNSEQVFHRLFISVMAGDIIIKRGLDSSKLFYPDICMCLSQVRAWIPVNCFTPIYVCVCRKSGPGFHYACAGVFWFSVM